MITRFSKRYKGINRFLGLFFILISAPYVWAGFYYPANPNFTGDALFIAHNGVARFDVNRLQPLWRAAPGLSADAPVVTATAVLAGSSSGLAALDRQSGKQLWRLRSPARIFSPSASDQIAYAGSEDGILRAVLISTGAVLWQRRFDGWIYPPAIYADRLVGGGQEQRLYAIGRSDGKLLWQIPLSQELVYRPVDIDGKHVVVTTFSGEILALSAADAAVYWRVRDSVANLSPVVADGRLYFRTFAGPLKVRSATDGQLLWQSRRQLSGHPIQVVNGYVLARDDSGNVFVLDAQDGRTLWQQRIQGEPIGKPIMLANRLILFTDSRGLHGWPKATAMNWSTTSINKETQ